MDNILAFKFVMYAFRPLIRFHVRKVLSLLIDTANFPDEWIATELTAALCP